MASRIGSVDLAGSPAKPGSPVTYWCRSVKTDRVGIDLGILLLQLNADLFGIGPVNLTGHGRVPLFSIQRETRRTSTSVE